MTPKRPYFLRALHEWLTDNDFTPYLLINVADSELVAPTEFAQNDVLTVAISYQATKDLLIENDFISFSARFNGVSHDLWVPMRACMGLVAKEDQNHALIFDPNEYPANGDTPSNNSDDGNKPKIRKPNFKVIK